MTTSNPFKPEDFKEKDFWTHVRGAARHVPFLKDAIAMYFCAGDAKTPLYAKGVLLGALAYFAIPADAIPDVLIGLGFTDDATVIAAALAAMGKNIKPQHYEQAEAVLDGR